MGQRGRVCWARAEVARRVRAKSTGARMGPMLVQMKRFCPAGRAHYAWSDHFVVCVPVFAG